MLDNLNEMQIEAVKHKDGPLLILAGAGSGKTKVLTTRIAYLIKEYGIRPDEILAITFTISMLGYIFMTYILVGITKLPLLNEKFLLNSTTMLISLLIIFGCNIIFGLLPVYKTIRKTPANILSRTDID